MSIQLKPSRENFLLLATLLFTAAYSWQIIAQPTGIIDVFINIILYITWAAFALDYAYGLLRAQERRKWFIRHIPELFILVVPAVRSLRLIRFLGLIAIFQRIAGNNIRGKVISYIIFLSLILIYLISLAVLDAERGHPNSSIHNFGDAIWWSFTTMTTVGYGDLAPVTIQGRIIAVALMIGGIGLLGIITATLASWLLEQIEEGSRKEEISQAQRLKDMENELREIKEILLKSSQEKDDPKEETKQFPN